MGRLYSVPFENVSITAAAQDVWVLSAAATKLVVLHAFSLTSAYTTDERVRLRMLRRSGAGSGGTSVSGASIAPNDQGNAISAASTLSYTVTTPGTAGLVLNSWQWSQQGELLYLPTPEMRPIISVSGFLALNLVAGPAATRTWSGFVTFEEI
jgi:hypothetical protein